MAGEGVFFVIVPEAGLDRTAGQAKQHRQRRELLPMTQRKIRVTAAG